MLYRSIAFFCVLAATSCLDNKDYTLDKLSLTPTVALPLAFGQISILDLISDKDSSYLKVYPDGLLYFAYPPKTLVSQDIKGLFALPDNITTTSLRIPPGLLPPLAKDLRTDSIVQNIDLGLSPEQLSEVGFKAGSVNYSVNVSPANLNLGFEVNLVLTDIVDKTTLVPMNVTVGTVAGSKPMQNYIGKMTKNTFNVKMVLVLKKRTNSVVVPLNTKINVTLSFKGMDFSYIKGFFGDKTATLPPQTFEISVFESSLNKAKVSVVTPVVTLSIRNDYGVPCQVIFSQLEAQKTGASLPFQINPTSPFSLNVPSLFGNSATTTVSVVNGAELLSFAPTKLAYAASARINKGAKNGNNFLADTSKLWVTMSAEVPLYGKASGISLADTMNLDFGDLSASSVILASLKVKTVNEMPLDAYVQLYLTDKNYHILDSIFASNQTYIVKASSVTSAGDLAKAGTSNLELDLSADKLNKLFSSSHLIMRSKMNTTKDANGVLLNVKFKSAYKLKMNVGLKAKLNLSTK